LADKDRYLGETVTAKICPRHFGLNQGNAFLILGEWTPRRPATWCWLP